MLTKKIDFEFAMRLAFGKDSFPWFNMYVGDNFDSMAQLFKGVRDGRQVVEFNVPENSSQFLAVAADETTGERIDFYLVDPKGNIYEADLSSRSLSREYCDYTYFDNPVRV